MGSIGAGEILLAIIAYSAKLYARMDKYNNYIEQDTYWISLIFPLLFIFACIRVTLCYRHVLKMREWLSLLLYAVIPIPCYLLELLLREIYFSYVGVALSIYLIYVNNQVELKYQLREKEAELAEGRIAIMLSQVQPHFLYNALEAIDRLCFVNPEEAHRAIVTYSEYLRMNMDSLTQKKLITFEKELEHTQHYLWLEQLRFGERVQVIYDIQIKDFMVPVLTLQPMVENAVRYGVTKREEGGTIIIRAEKVENMYRITVTDDGVGFDPRAKLESNRSHTGISSVRNRLNKMCDGTLSIKSTVDVGTVAVIEIPGL